MIAGAYAAYLLISYDRIEDNLPLEVYSEAQTQEAQAGREYTAVTYNIGFGAYTPDFTFFMDGGTQSWANSKESVIDCINGSAETVKSLHTDVVFFQEVDDGSTRSYQVDEHQMLDDAFDGYDSVFARNYHSAFLAVPSCRDCDIPYCDESFTVILDGFMISDNITPTYADIVDNGFHYSDHNPVVMKFKLN